MRALALLVWDTLYSSIYDPTTVGDAKFTPSLRAALGRHMPGRAYYRENCIDPRAFARVTRAEHHAMMVVVGLLLLPLLLVSLYRVI